MAHNSQASSDDTVARTPTQSHAAAMAAASSIERTITSLSTAAYRLPIFKLYANAHTHTHLYYTAACICIRNSCFHFCTYYNTLYSSRGARKIQFLIIIIIIMDITARINCHLVIDNRCRRFYIHTHTHTYKTLNRY